jgi:predicted dehydrogenase
VILATPPGFRPLHFEAAVQAGRHVFLERPVAVDATGVRRVLAAGKEAEDQGLAVAVGLQRRHEVAYRETIARLQEGAIGDLRLIRVYWNGAGVSARQRQASQSELEHQLRNWRQFAWLSGDPIVEQFVQNLDVANWLQRGAPVSAQGQGAPAAQAHADESQVFDQHFVEFTYADGVKLFGQCRRIHGCWNNVSEHAHGTRGRADVSGGKIYDSAERLVWRTDGARGGHQQEHHDLFANLRRGLTVSEAEYGARSTMTAIMGRAATYSGQLVTWDAAFTAPEPLADVDQLASLRDAPPIQRDKQGRYPMPIPGVG